MAFSHHGHRECLRPDHLNADTIALASAQRSSTCCLRNFWRMLWRWLWQRKHQDELLVKWIDGAYRGNFDRVFHSYAGTTTRGRWYHTKYLSTRSSDA